MKRRDHRLARAIDALGRIYRDAQSRDAWLDASGRVRCAVDGQDVSTPPCARRHQYGRVALAPVIHRDGSATTPSVEACSHCGRRKAGTFDIR